MSSRQRSSVPAPSVVVFRTNDADGTLGLGRPEPFYKVVFEGAWAEANPLRLSRPELLELKVGNMITVVLSFERFESDPRLRVGEIIGSIDDFAKLDADHKNAAIEDLRRYPLTHAVGEIVRIEADSHRGNCLGLLVVREVAELKVTRLRQCVGMHSEQRRLTTNVQRPPGTRP